MSRYGITYTDITLKDHNEPGGCPLNFDQIVQPGITERTMSVLDKPTNRREPNWERLADQAMRYFRLSL